MKDLSTITKLKADIQTMISRRSELEKAKRIIGGGTQQRFVLHAGDIKIDLCGSQTRDYTFEMKPCYDMVKLGLTKALDKQMDECTDAIKTLKEKARIECGLILDSLGS